jgi:hypothetical protein
VVGVYTKGITPVNQLELMQLNWDEVLDGVEWKG